MAGPSRPDRFRRILRRFVVHDESMRPSLAAGQGLVGVRSATSRRGELRVFEHPDRPGFWMVKRVAAVDVDGMWVRSDNHDVATIDSRQLGPIPVSGSYRVVVRIPLRLM